MNSNPFFSTDFGPSISLKGHSQLQNPTDMKCLLQPQIKFSTAKQVGNGSWVRPALGSPIPWYNFLHLTWIKPILIVEGNADSLVAPLKAA